MSCPSTGVRAASQSGRGEATNIVSPRCSMALGHDISRFQTLSNFESYLTELDILGSRRSDVGWLSWSNFVIPGRLSDSHDLELCSNSVQNMKQCLSKIEYVYNMARSRPLGRWFTLLSWLYRARVTLQRIQRQLQAASFGLFARTSRARYRIKGMSRDDKRSMMSCMQRPVIS